MSIVPSRLLAVACAGTLLVLCGATPASRPTSTAPPAFSERVAERERMVAELLEYDPPRVKEKRVIEAMRRVPRHAFVPEASRRHAYADSPLPIGKGQTISQPYIVALMTELAGIEKGMKVLEVGTGSGYQAAILAEMTPSVYTVEIIPELATTAAATLKALGYSSIATRTGDGYYGWAENAPYDRILVTAAAAQIPPPLLRQLKPGGRMVIPVGSTWATQDLLLVTKDAEGRTSTRSVLPVRFVPLVGGAGE